MSGSSGLLEGRTGIFNRNDDRIFSLFQAGIEKRSNLMKCIKFKSFEKQHSSTCVGSATRRSRTMMPCLPSSWPPCGAELKLWGLSSLEGVSWTSPTRTGGRLSIGQPRRGTWTCWGWGCVHIVIQSVQCTSVQCMIYYEYTWYSQTINGSALHEHICVCVLCLSHVCLYVCDVHMYVGRVNHLHIHMYLLIALSYAQVRMDTLHTGVIMAKHTGQHWLNCIALIAYLTN